MKLNELLVQESTVSMQVNTNALAGEAVKATLMLSPIHIKAYYASPFSMEPEVERDYRRFFKKHKAKKVGSEEYTLVLKDTMELKELFDEANLVFCGDNVGDDDFPWDFEFEVTA